MCQCEKNNNNDNTDSTGMHLLETSTKKRRLTMLPKTPTKKTYTLKGELSFTGLYATQVKLVQTAPIPE